MTSFHFIFITVYISTIHGLTNFLFIVITVYISNVHEMTNRLFILIFFFHFPNEFARREIKANDNGRTKYHTGEGLNLSIKIQIRGPTWGVDIIRTVDKKCLKSSEFGTGGQLLNKSNVGLGNSCYMPVIIIEIWQYIKLSSHVMYTSCLHIIWQQEVYIT